MRLLALFIAVDLATAIPAADLRTEKAAVQFCYFNGFPDATCAAVKQDCDVLDGDRKQYPFCYKTVDANPLLVETRDDVNAIVLNKNNFLGCLNDQQSFTGAPLQSHTVVNDRNIIYPADWYAPSFPKSTKYETSLTVIPGTTCKEPCTRADCDHHCSGAGCAAFCTGVGCGGGCTGDFCSTKCMGNRCGAGAVGRLAAFSCGEDKKDDTKRPLECGTGCDGASCANRCTSPGCGTMCTGRYCAMACGIYNPTESIGCGAHCVGLDCAFGCTGVGCGVGAREKATDPFTTLCGDYKYQGHCGKLTALAGLRCAWRAGECVDDRPDTDGLRAGLTAMTALTTAALVASAVAPKKEPA